VVHFIGHGDFDPGKGCAAWEFSSSIGSVFPARADVVVALGGGVTPAGQPQPVTMARTRRAIALYRCGRARQIVMSGAYGMYDPPPSRAEAATMAEIALAEGVPQDDIAVEARSRDTIGNIWFTKPILRERQWRRVIVVTSDWHAPRVRYLIKTIWGPGYVVAIEPVTGEQGTRRPEEIAIWETGLLALSRRWFAAIQPGDDTAIGTVLTREHPIYADHPQTTLAKLAEIVTRTPAVRSPSNY
jgi:uncharacterized SAM-binding protein YcdF (DUF218 family)